VTRYPAPGELFVPEGRQIPHHDEAIVLRTWPFHEADLLVSLFTRQRGKVKGVARHAMRSRSRFGGALEPATQVFAHYTERPRPSVEGDLVRLDSFEIVWSPLSAPVDPLRAAALQLVVEILDEAMPDLAPDDNVFRLAVAALRGIGHPDHVHTAVTYFCLWMARLMGWWPELAHCAACGLDLHGADVFWSPSADGVTCADDISARRPNSHRLSAAAVAETYRMARFPLDQLLTEINQGRELFHDLGALTIAVLERHLEHRLRSAASLT
jgi:DNA repair protein RecO (recombination protein O)